MPPSTQRMRRNDSFLRETKMERGADNYKGMHNKEAPKSSFRLFNTQQCSC